MNLPPLGNSYVEFNADTSALTMRRVVNSRVSALFDHNYLDAPVSEFHYCGNHGGYVDVMVRYENPLYKIANPGKKMKQLEVYRKYCVKTAAAFNAPAVCNVPPRFSYDWFRNALDEVWEQRSNLLGDWVEMEHFLTDVLRSDLLSNAQKIQLCKDGIDISTRRGRTEW